MRDPRSSLPLHIAAQIKQSDGNSSATNKQHDGVYEEYFVSSGAKMINTDVIMVEAIRKEHPELHLTITPVQTCRLLSYAASGEAVAVPVDSSVSQDLKWRLYSPPATRLSGSGFLYDRGKFGKYGYTWNRKEYILYNVECGEGSYNLPMTYLLGSTPQENDELILAASKYLRNSQRKVFIYDGGYWDLSSELWESVQHSKWEDVILDSEMKKSIIGEIEKFYNSRDRYRKLRVPWKRGIIFHGPPGNGKTISIKAMMHTLDARSDPIPTLYVRSLSSYMGAEYSISEIFSKARQEAPCFLVFEDLDSLVTDDVRSYFLNEVDGLQNNDGILMVGSTNHLERLDPGISKRPSRFDRKYLFPDPSMPERVRYCQFWRTKLADNKDIDFPTELTQAIASITDGFSFAYIQEAFVAALLAIANGDADYNSPLLPWRDGEEIQQGCGRILHHHHHPYPTSNMLIFRGEDLERFILWREIQKVIKTLREELDSE